MLVNLTAEEKKKMQELINKFLPERKQIQQAIDKATSKAELTRLLMNQQTTIEALEKALADQFNDIQRAHFEPVKKGGASAIIDHAREQLPELLPYIQDFTTNECKSLSPEMIKESGIGTLKDGKILLRANYAFEMLKEELKLHIESLSEDKEHLKMLTEMIIEAVENSDITDREEIKADNDKLLDIKRFRRNPLQDIETLGLMNDKVSAHVIKEATKIFNQETNGQLTLQWGVNQASKKGEQVAVFMSLTYEGKGEVYNVNKRLTAYDKQVMEAISTRFHYWTQENPLKPLYITPQEIWRTMNGKNSSDGRAKPSATQIKKVCESVDKMRFTRFYMDIRNEVKSYGLSFNDERINGGIMETYVLNSSKVEFTTEKGNTLTGYRINEEPIIYTYNKGKGHLLYVPYEMLDTSEFTSDSENVAEFKGYLLQQIQLMKNADKGKGRFKRSNVILLDTIYEVVGILPPEERAKETAFTSDQARNTYIRKTRKADREKIENILEAWKAKAWIKDFATLNKDNKPIGDKQQARAFRIDIE